MTCVLDFLLNALLLSRHVPVAILRKTFVVTCEGCRHDVPSGVTEFPFQSITVECPLCSELRRYLPSELFLGKPDQLVTRQQRAGCR
jgi:hypothetical protein